MAWKGWEDYVPPTREELPIRGDGARTAIVDDATGGGRSGGHRDARADRERDQARAGVDSERDDRPRDSRSRGVAAAAVRKLGRRSRIPTAKTCYVDPASRALLEPELALGVIRARQQEGNLAPPLERFQSKREAKRYIFLLGEQDAGRIHELRRQVRFPLNVRRPDGIDVTIACYIADFVYIVIHAKFPPGASTQERVIEDCKGHRTEMYKRSKKHVEAQYGVLIKET